MNIDMDAEQQAFEFAWRTKQANDMGRIPNTGPARSNQPDRTYIGDAAEFAWKWWLKSRMFGPEAPVTEDKTKALVHLDASILSPIDRLWFQCWAIMDGEDFLTLKTFFDDVRAHSRTPTWLVVMNERRSKEWEDLKLAIAEHRNYDAASHQRAIDVIDECIKLVTDTQL